MGILLVGASASATPTLPERWLARHNAVRAEAGAPPLRWDDELAADAAAWARQLAQTRTFEHAPRDRVPRVQGENLWMGTQDAFSPEAMIDDWAAERTLYRPGRFPDVAIRGTWHDVGHYTQMIWGKTAAVGCALASNGDDDVFVCRYFPAGNVLGQRVIDPASSGITD